MAEINNVIAEASQDLQAIEDFVNLPAGSDVRPRLLPSVNVGTLAGTRDAIFEAGGLPATPFKTKALMTASSLANDKYAMVTDDTVNNGLYVKTAGAWVKSGYDPLAQANAYTDVKTSETLAAIEPKIKSNLAYGIVGDISIDNTKNVYDSSLNIDGIFRSSVAFSSNATATLYVMPVTAGQVITVKTNAALGILMPSLTNSNTISVSAPSTRILETSIESVGGMYRFIIPSGFKYLTLNGRLSGATHYDTWVINVTEPSVTGIYDGNLVDINARKALDTKFGADNSVSVGSLSIINSKYFYTGFYIANPNIVAANATAGIQVIPLEAGETYSVYLPSESMFSTQFAKIYPLDSPPVFTGKILSEPILLSPTSIPEVRTFVVPDGVKWGAFTSIMTSLNWNVKDTVVINKGAVSAKLQPAYIDKISGYELRDNKAQALLTDLIAASNISILKGKRWAAIGDSITGVYVHASEPYPVQVSAKAGGMLMYNYGDSGSGFYRNRDIASRITQGGIEYITIALGTNDSSGSMPMGEFLDTTDTTISGCINIMLQGLMTKYPLAKIAMFTPLPKPGNWGSTGSLKGLSDLIIKYCAHYSLPCLDLYRTSNFYPSVTANMSALTTDGLHPNNAGHALLAHKIFRFMESM